jgi:hypothetical protein
VVGGGTFRKWILVKGNYINGEVLLKEILEFVPFSLFFMSQSP